MAALLSVEDISNMTGKLENAMPKYDNYEYNLSLRKKHALDPYDHGLSDDYFDQHALSVDRRFRVKKMSKILPKIKWNNK